MSSAVLAAETIPGRAASKDELAPDQRVLNFHIQHPGEPTKPSDPNAAFYLDGIYHLHYIMGHPWKGKRSYSFVHLTSPDMLHWTWQAAKLQPTFTGHGMFSGTGFMTKDGAPAVIYHGAGTDKNYIVVARDRRLSNWEKPYSVDVKKSDGSEAKMRHWDPDCFLIGNTYYGIAGGRSPQVFKSDDLRNWTLIGDFLRGDMPDVAIGEDVSCPNFFPLGTHWLLLGISHPLGCRYYIGDWDANLEQFVPTKHGRMNWRTNEQSIWGPPWRVDFFAPESLLTADGRRVMWAWLNVGRMDGNLDDRAIQSLPRELTLPEDGILRIKPLRELEALRYSPSEQSDIELTKLANGVEPDHAPTGKVVTTIASDSFEVRITIGRKEAERKLFGFTLFAEDRRGGLPIMFRPENRSIRVGSAEAPFDISALPLGEDIELRIFVDQYLVEVFANNRQAIVASYPDNPGEHVITAFTVGASTRIKRLESWKLKPTNQGFLEARRNRIWEPSIN